MKSVRKRLTYANVMSSIAVFLVLAGGTAFAASQLGKESVGTKQLKKEAVSLGENQHRREKLAQGRDRPGRCDRRQRRRRSQRRDRPAGPEGRQGRKR